MSSESFRSQLAGISAAARFSNNPEKPLARQGEAALATSGGARHFDKSRRDRASPRTGPIRMLRLAQVIAVTGLGKTKIYELQAEGTFPMRVKLTAHSVAWIEEDVQTWLARRVEASPPLSTM
ncbi:MAG TPA: AlpA family phage regulatory protein [Steroidobacteraceae bacterium]|nr:AlpA family phage regulatory protein [Steroidobacteraceae bacterium]